MIYQHINTSIYESINTYRTDKRKQHEPKPQTKLNPISQAAQAQQERTTQSQGTATQTGRNQRYRTTQNATAKQATKPKAEQNNMNGTKGRKSSEQSQGRTAHRRQNKHSPQAHRLKYSGFYCGGIMKHGGKFRGVWGIVRRNSVIYMYVYIYIYMYIYTIAGDFLQSLTRTRPPATPAFLKISTVTNSYNLVTKSYKMITS